MSDMVHKKATIDGYCLQLRYGRPRYLINITPGMGEILNELAILIECTEEMLAPRAIWGAHRRKHDPFKRNPAWIIWCRGGHEWESESDGNLFMPYSR
jgi:hypothetical protein